MIDAITIRQFSKYAIVGLASNLTLYLAYLMLTTLGVGHKSAMSALYVTGVLVTFVANKKWSFSHSGMTHTVFVRYVTAYVIGYVINLGLLAYGVDYLHLPHQIVQAVAIVIVAVSLFLIHKFWVFAPGQRESTP